MLTDEAGEECHLEDETPPDVFKALKALIEKADDLIAAIDVSSVALAKVDGTTGQFEAEVSALSERDEHSGKGHEGRRRCVMTLPVNQIVQGDCVQILKTFPSAVR